MTDRQDAEQLDSSVGAIPRELVVTTEVVNAYRRLLASGARLIP